MLLILQLFFLNLAQANLSYQSGIYLPEVRAAKCAHIGAATYISSGEAITRLQPVLEAYRHLRGWSKEFGQSLQQKIAAFHHQSEYIFVKNEAGVDVGALVLTTATAKQKLTMEDVLGIRIPRTTDKIFEFRFYFNQAEMKLETLAHIHSLAFSVVQRHLQKSGQSWDQTAIFTYGPKDSQSLYRRMGFKVAEAHQFPPVRPGGETKDWKILVATPNELAQIALQKHLGRIAHLWTSPVPLPIRLPDGTTVTLAAGGSIHRYQDKNEISLGSDGVVLEQAEKMLSGVFRVGPLLQPMTVEFGLSKQYSVRVSGSDIAFDENRPLVVAETLEPILFKGENGDLDIFIPKGSTLILGPNRELDTAVAANGKFIRVGKDYAKEVNLLNGYVSGVSK